MLTASITSDITTGDSIAVTDVMNTIDYENQLEVPFLVRVFLSGIVILLNSAVLFILVQQRVHQRDCSNVFLVNLIVASCLGGLSILLFSVRSYMPHHFSICVMLFNIFEVIGLAMYMSLLFVNVDQLIKIEYPLRYPSLVTDTVVCLGVFITWILPLSLQFAMFFSDETLVNFCRENLSSAVPSLDTYMLYNILAGYIVPVVIIFVVQCRIIYTVRKQRRVFNSVHERQGSLVHIDKLWPSIVTASIIFGTVFLTSSPLYLFIIISAFRQTTIGDFGSFSICLSLQYLAFFLNPIIYAARFPEVKRLVCCRFCHK